MLVTLVMLVCIFHVSNTGSRLKYQRVVVIFIFCLFLVIGSPGMNVFMNAFFSLTVSLFLAYFKQEKLWLYV